MKQTEAIDSMEKFMDKVGDSSLSYGQIKDLDDFNGAVFRVKLRQEELTEEQNEVVETTGKLMNELFDFYERMTESDSENENILDIRKKRSVNKQSNPDPGNNGLSYIKENEEELVNQMLNIEEFLDKTKSRQKCGPTIERTFEDIKKIQKKLKDQLKSINPKDAQSKQGSFIKLIDDHHNDIKQTLTCQKIWGRKLVDQFGRDKKIASLSNYKGKQFKKPEDCKEPCKEKLECEGWTFDDSGEVKICHLKTDLQGERFSESWNENFWSARLVDCSSEMKRECKYKAYNQCIADICQDSRMKSCYDRNDIKTFDDKDRKKHNTYNKEISCFLNHCPWMPQIDLSTTTLEVTEYLYSNLVLADSECKKATCTISVKSLLGAYIQLDADQKSLVTSEFIKQVYNKVEVPERARIEAELKNDTAYHQTELLESTISFKPAYSSIDAKSSDVLELNDYCDDCELKWFGEGPIEYSCDGKCDKDHPNLITDECRNDVGCQSLDNLEITQTFAYKENNKINKFGLECTRSFAGTSGTKSLCSSCKKERQVACLKNSLDLVFKPQKLNKTKAFYTAPKGVILTGNQYAFFANRDRSKAITRYENRVDVLNDMTRNGDLITDCISGKTSADVCKKTLKKPTFDLFSANKEEMQKLKIFPKKEQEELLELMSGKNSKERKTFIAELKSKTDNDIANEGSLSASDKENLKKLGALTGVKDGSRKNARTQLKLDKETLRKEVQTSRKESLTDNTKIASSAERSSSLMPQKILSSNGMLEVSGKNVIKQNSKWQRTKQFMKNVPNYVGTSPKTNLKGSRTAGRITGAAGTISNG